MFTSLALAALLQHAVFAHEAKQSQKRTSGKTTEEIIVSLGAPEFLVREKAQADLKKRILKDGLPGLDAVYRSLRETTDMEIRERLRALLEDPDLAVVTGIHRKWCYHLAPHTVDFDLLLIPKGPDVYEVVVETFGPKPPKQLGFYFHSMDGFWKAVPPQMLGGRISGGLLSKKELNQYEGLQFTEGKEIADEMLGMLAAGKMGCPIPRLPR